MKWSRRGRSRRSRTSSAFRSSIAPSMTEKPAHLADLVVAAVGIGIALVCLSVSAGPFEGQIISGAAHLALSVVLAAGCARGLHFAVRLQRPRWVWPVVVVSLSFGFHGLVRVINALDRSEPVARRTHVAQWHSKYVSRRGSGKWVRRVVLASWKSPSEQLEFRVPEGAVTRESHFADTRRARLRQAWEARMKEADEKRPCREAPLDSARDRPGRAGEAESGSRAGAAAVSRALARAAPVPRVRAVRRADETRRARARTPGRAPAPERALNLTRPRGTQRALRR